MKVIFALRLHSSLEFCYLFKYPLKACKTPEIDRFGSCGNENCNELLLFSSTPFNLRDVKAFKFHCKGGGYCYLNIILHDNLYKVKIGSGKLSLHDLNMHSVSDLN